MRIRALPLIVSALLVAGPLSGTARADSEAIADKIFDGVLLRPLGGFTVLVGGAMFVPAAFLAAPSGRDGIGEAWDILVESPYRSTADRPLGDFSQ